MTLSIANIVGFTKCRKGLQTVHFISSIYNSSMFICTAFLYIYNILRRVSSSSVAYRNSENDIFETKTSLVICFRCKEAAPTICLPDYCIAVLIYPTISIQCRLSHTDKYFGRSAVTVCVNVKWLHSILANFNLSCWASLAIGNTRWQIRKFLYERFYISIFVFDKTRWSSKTSN